MLPIVAEKLASMYAGNPQLGVDGKEHQIDSTTKVSEVQGHKLAELHRQVRPKVSLEVGMAYGYSSLYFLEAIAEGDYGEKHIAIDPNQMNSRYAGIGVKGAELVGLSSKLEFMEERSDYALPTLYKRGVRVQYAYIDGSHWFEDALSDFCLSHRLLDKGGIIVLDDMWMPSLKKVASFVETNRSSMYKRMDINFDNIAAYEKIADGDDRHWTHFMDF